MTSKLVQVVLSTIVVSALFTLALLSCGFQVQAGRAASIESKGFDVLAQRVFGDAAPSDVARPVLISLDRKP